MKERLPVSEREPQVGDIVGTNPDNPKAVLYAYLGKGVFEPCTQAGEPSRRNATAFSCLWQQKTNLFYYRRVDRGSVYRGEQK